MELYNSTEANDILTFILNKDIEELTTLKTDIEQKMKFSIYALEIENEIAYNFWFEIADKEDRFSKEDFQAIKNQYTELEPNREALRLWKNYQHRVSFIASMLNPNIQTIILR